jgi:hypothetical protein
VFIDFPENEVVVQGLEKIPIPEMARMRQFYEDDFIVDIEGSLKRQLKEKFPDPSSFEKKRIAITVGSRGIPHLPLIVRTLCEKLKKWHADPFIVPAMGSHCNGSAEGQAEYLRGMGITEEAVGVPILSSMEVVQYGTLADGTRCYCDKYAYESDGVIVLNKIKPHTEYRAPYESGLLKMIAIGLGKHKGASEIHFLGFEGFAQRVFQVGKTFLETGKCLFAIGLVQNAYDKISELEVILPEDILIREEELLKIAKRRIATFKGREIDVLIIDEIGKNISGAGHDPNITGRNCSGLPGFGDEILKVKRVFVRGLSKESHHNATGLGLADVTTLRCVRDVDWDSTWTNMINSTMIKEAGMPLYMNNDRDALMLALRTLNRTAVDQAKVVRIRNTLCMTDIQVSRSYWESVCQRSDVELCSDFAPMRFDASGYLIDECPV